MAPDPWTTTSLQQTQTSIHNDDLETLENSSEDWATYLETAFEKHDDGIGFSAPAGILKT